MKALAKLLYGTALVHGLGLVTSPIKRHQVAVVQAMQTIVLVLVLSRLDPASLAEVLRRWRPSPGAGLCDACASVGWFVAPALSPAAPVQALGIIEVPVAAIAGQGFFQETLSFRQIAAGAAVVVGVLLTTLF